MADLADQQQLEIWLKTQPREVSVAIAARAAARVFPTLSGEFVRARRSVRVTWDTVLPSIRAIGLTLTAATYPTRGGDFRAVAKRAADHSADARAAAYATAAASPAADSAAYAAATYAAATDSGAAAGAAPAYASAAAGEAATAYAAAAAAVARDKQFIIDGGSAESLATKPFWLGEVPNTVRDLWTELKGRLLRLDEDWDVWTRWYEARLEGHPSPGGEALDIFRVTLPEATWRDGPRVVNAVIKEEETTARKPKTVAIGVALETDTALPVEAVRPPNVQPQTPGALRFGAKDDGPVDLIEFDGSELIADTADSRDRYGEVARLIVHLLNLHEYARDALNNANDDVCRETELLREALGRSIREIRPGLLIPRGDALRNRLTSQIDRDALSDMPPLSEGMLVALKNLVSAYNVFVALDVELAMRDEASLGPDAANNLVPTDEGTSVARSAVDLGAATERTSDALLEEAKVAPPVPDPSDRRSRRYSEGAKNLGRVLLGRALAFTQWVRTHPFKSVVIGAGASYTAGHSVLAAGRWVLANEAWLLKYFSDNPSMIELVNELIAILRNLPLA